MGQKKKDLDYLVQQNLDLEILSKKKIGLKKIIGENDVSKPFANFLVWIEQNRQISEWLLAHDL